MASELFETIPEAGMSSADRRADRSGPQIPDLPATNPHDNDGDGPVTVVPGGNTTGGLQSPAAAVFSLIAQAASDPNVNVDKMKALLDMQITLVDRQREAEFNEAFVRYQTVQPRITKKGEIVYPPNPDAKTPAGRAGSRTKYARWEDIMSAILPLLSEHGFGLTYDAPPTADGRVTCKATLIHQNGWSRSSVFGPMPLDTSGGKNNLQAAGSSDSYGKRFATRDLLNLVYEGEDDDGVAGGADPITPEQIQQLDTLIRETSSRLDGFLKYMAVDALADINKSQFPAAINALMAKKK